MPLGKLEPFQDEPRGEGKKSSKFHSSSIAISTFFIFRVVEHPFHNNIPITDFNVLQNDFALLELTESIDLRTTTYVNAACLPSMAPVSGADIVSQ